MSKWNKYRLKDFAIDKNGKPYLYASFNTYGLRGSQPQKKAVFFPSKILDGEYVIVPKDKVDELERNVDWKVKFPTALESIQTKEIDIVPKSVVEEIEGMPLETDKFSLLSQAIQVENDSVIFYQNLMEIFPEWKPVLQDITNEELKHIGQLEALRNESPQVGQKVDEGENEADAQMKGIAAEGVKNMSKYKKINKSAKESNMDSSENEYLCNVRLGGEDEDEWTQEANDEAQSLYTNYIDNLIKFVENPKQDIEISTQGNWEGDDQEIHLSIRPSNKAVYDSETLNKFISLMEEIVGNVSDDFEIYDEGGIIIPTDYNADHGSDDIDELGGIVEFCKKLCETGYEIDFESHLFESPYADEDDDWDDEDSDEDEEDADESLQMKGQMNYQGLGAKESYYTDAKINAAFEDLSDELLELGGISKKSQVSPQKNLKLAKVPEGIGVESSTNLSDEQSKINNLSDTNADSLASQLQKIASEDYDWEDEEADESFTKDEAESEDPEAKEACACEAYSEECTRLALNIEDAESDDDLANCEAEIETAHANGDITEEEFNYLFGVINSKR